MAQYIGIYCTIYCIVSALHHFSCNANFGTERPVSSFRRFSSFRSVPPKTEIVPFRSSVPFLRRNGDGERNGTMPSRNGKTLVTLHQLNKCMPQCRGRVPQCRIAEIWENLKENSLSVGKLLPRSGTPGLPEFVIGRTNWTINKCRTLISSRTLGKLKLGNRNLTLIIYNNNKVELEVFGIGTYL